MSYAVGKWSGLSRGMSASDFNPIELARGTRVEMEHTSNPRVAQRIAMDHLSEDSLYYQKLALFHVGAFWSPLSVKYGKRSRAKKELEVLRRMFPEASFRVKPAPYQKWVIESKTRKPRIGAYSIGIGIGIGADMTDFQRQDLDLRKTAMTWEILSSIAFAIFGLILFTRR